MAYTKLQTALRFLLKQRKLQQRKKMHLNYKIKIFAEI